MKKLFVVLLVSLTAGCSTYTSHDRWNEWALAHECKPTGKQKILLAGSVYATPQRRKVFEFSCNVGIVWSDLGNYAKYNEWLTL